MDSIVSLKTIILSEGWFVAIIPAAANSLFSAQLIKFFLFLTFANHALTNPVVCPPFFNREDSDLGSDVLRYSEIFLILAEHSS